MEQMTKPAPSAKPSSWIPSAEVMFENYNDSQRPDHDALAAHYGDSASIL